MKKNNNIPRGEKTRIFLDMDGVCTNFLGLLFHIPQENLSIGYHRRQSKYVLSKVSNQTFSSSSSSSTMIGCPMNTLVTSPNLILNE